MDLTSRLALNKPNGDPELGDFLDVDKLNQNFDKIDAAISTTVCTSATRPATPFQGQVIFETDSSRAFVWSGSNWLQIPLTNAAGTHILLSGLELNLTRAAATDTVFYGQVSGDSSGRLLIRADGRIEIGPGNAGRDVNLYRRSANHLGTDDSFQAGGFSSGAASQSLREAPSASITTVETVIQSLTFNAVSGAGYMVHATQHFQSTVANDVGVLALRWASGTSVTAAGALIAAIYPNADVVNRGQPYGFHGLLISNVTGQVTVGVTLRRDLGTGSVVSHGSVDEAQNLITVVGA